MCRAVQSQERFPLAPAVLKLQPQVMTPRPGHRGETGGTGGIRPSWKRWGDPCLCLDWVGGACPLPRRPFPAPDPRARLGGSGPGASSRKPPRVIPGELAKGRHRGVRCRRDPTARLPLRHPP